MLDFIAIPFGYVIEFFYNITQNYTLALLLFALIVKVVLFPFGIKQQKNQVKQARLRPMEMAIRKKYAGRNDKPTQMKMNEEIQKLYSEEHFSPLSGCLPMLLQFPIIIALYNVVINPLRYMLHFSAEKILEFANLAYTRGVMTEFANITDGAVTQVQQYEALRLANAMRQNFDVIKDAVPELSQRALPDFNLFGIDLSQTPNLNVIGEGFSVKWLLLLIPILTFVVQFFSTRIMKKLSFNPAMNQQSGMSGCIMDFAMPMLSVFFCFIVPAAIAVYWMFQGIFSALQQFILYKMFPLPTFTEEELKEAERKVNAMQKNKERPKSLYKDDDEDYSEYAKQLAAKYAEEEAEAERLEKEAREAREAAEQKESPEEKGNADGAPELQDDKSGFRFKKKKK